MPDDQHVHVSCDLQCIPGTQGVVSVNGATSRWLEKEGVEACRKVRSHADPGQEESASAFVQIGKLEEV